MAALNRRRLLAIVEPIEPSSRRIKTLILLAGVSALVAPAGGLSLGFSTRAVHHGYGARWSPSGKRLAFVNLRPGNSSLEVVNATGKGLEKLSGSWYVAQAAEWSPRGGKLAFIRMANVSRRNETSSLWTINTATRVKKRLAVSAARFDSSSPLAWSPSGSRIAFTRLEEPPNGASGYRIYMVNANGGALRLLTYGQDPDWSPDGKRIIFEAFAGWPPSIGQIWVVNADGTGTRLLANSAGAASFSPDGKRIVFDRHGEIWTMNVDGSGQQQLTDGSGPDLAPLWSPDGGRILFARGSVRWQLYVINVDGSGLRQVSPSTALEVDPDWSPDGKRISFARCTSPAFRSCDVVVTKVG